MALYRYTDSRLEAVSLTTLSAERIRERQDLQRLLRDQIELIGEDLLVVAEEYGSFQDSRRRVDLLAIDRKGTLVVIELKRTDDGGHMELQALRYAAMVSTMTFDHLAETYAATTGVDASEARQTIHEWIEDPLDELPNQVRIILVAADFSAEITSTVLWLNANYNTDISCVRIVAYRLGEVVLFDLQQIIPLPEAKDFQIQQRQKGAVATAVRSGGRDFTRYDLVINGEEVPDLSKQAAVKIAMQKLYRAGVSVELIRGATQGGRWLPVHRRDGETVKEAFAREHPTRSSGHKWFDLGIEEDGVSWVCPRFGGVRTEAMLDGLTRVASPMLSLKWSAREAFGDDEEDD